MKFFLVSLAILGFASCTQNMNESNPAKQHSTNNSSAETLHDKDKIAEAAIILSRAQVPILCYHHIRPYRPAESMNMKSYSVTPAAFAEQMKTLSDSGYHTILPDQLYNYLAFGDPLPTLPIMLTFDDTDLEQFTIGATEMNKYNFKGVYFIMTIAIGRPRYMSREQLKQLTDEGHTIQGHTWDHHMVTKYMAEDWEKQLIEADKKLEDITGRKIQYFAYPFGLWNTDAIQALKDRSIKMAFQLSTKRDSIYPLFTVRRMIVPGTWTTQGMLKAMHTTFLR